MTSAPLRLLTRGLLLLPLLALSCTGTSDDDGNGDIFDLYDADKNGEVTREEWGGNMATFDRLDLNGDGIISFVEFYGEPDSGVAPDTGVAPDSGIIDSKCNPPGPELPMGQGPVRRGDMAFAWDTNCERVIMFYGDKAEPFMCGPAASDFLTEGYTFDPVRGRWAEITVNSSNNPVERARSSGVWDPNSNRFILFGGRWRGGTSGPYNFLDDIWAFDPSNGMWEQLAPFGAPNSPGGRMNTLLVADPANNRVLVHDGGQVTADFSAFIVDRGVWAFNLDDNTWERLAITGPEPTARLFHTGALDRMRQRLYIFGGGGEDAFTSPEFFDDLWYLDLNTLTWTEMPKRGVHPDGRIKGTMDWDEARDRLVLFAGHDDESLGNENDLWAFQTDSLGWELITEGDTFNRGQFGFCDFPADFANVDMASPERRESHMFLINGDRAFMYGGRTDCGLSNDTWILDLSTDTWEQVTESFNGMTCFRSGRTDCDDPQARKCG